MRCPTLSELPTSPLGKVGWPWTEAMPPVITADTAAWPRITIITPSFNQARFIEETIRSILLQGYPNLEYMVIDGGSQDGSVEIIARYASWLAYWVSEPDKGQSEAINKGFARATGEIVAWINSDDLLCPQALIRIGQAFREEPALGLVYGDYQAVDENGQGLMDWRTPEYDLGRMVTETWIAQGFVRRAALADATFFVRADLHYMMDWQLWLRVALRAPGRRLPGRLGQVRLHSDAKTVAATECFNQERQRITAWLYAQPDLPPVVRAQEKAAWAACEYAMAVNAYGQGQRGAALRHVLRSLYRNPWAPFTPKRLLFALGACLPLSWSVLLRRKLREWRHTPAYIKALTGAKGVSEK